MQLSGGGEVDCSTQITFYIETGEQTHILIADSCMTWNEWIDSDYNPFLPNGIDKLISKQHDYLGYDGVFYNFYDPDYEQIDSSSEIIDPTSYVTVNLQDKIKKEVTYLA